jgi:hypothetical protein
VKKLFFVLFLLPFICLSQIDSAVGVPLVGIHVGGQIPGGDLSSRFGANLDAGGMFAYKTKRNWIFGIESNYMYGKKVKEDVVKNLKTPEGFVTDNEGHQADLRITERGLGIHLFAGKVFKFWDGNPNSGLIVTIGMGYLQHKVNLYDAQQKIASLKGNLKYGYDRLCNGVSVSQFIGYLNLSENRLLNFYVGVQFYEASTQSVRKLNYDTGLRDTKKRTDILSGLRAGWILPLYKRKPSEYYTN